MSTRAATSPFAIAVERKDDSGVYVTWGNQLQAVIKTGNQDLIEAAPDVRRRRVNQFEELLLGLDAPFQILISSRAQGPSGVRYPRLREYLAERQSESPAFSRSVHVVLSQPATMRSTMAERLRRLVGARAADPIDPRVALNRQVERVLDGLRALNFRPTQLSGRELNRFLDDQLPGPLIRPNLRPDWQEEPDWLELDGDLTRTYYLDAYPGLELEAGWLGPLIELNGEYEISIRGIGVPLDAVMRHLNLKIRNLQATRLSDAASHAVSDPLTEAGLPEAISLRRDLAANQQRCFAIAMAITLHAPDRASLAEFGARAEEAAARTLARLVPSTFQMADGRVTTAPLGVDLIGADKLLPSGVVATMFPWLWDDLQHPAGHLIGFKKRGGASVLLDTFDEHLHNANVGIFGHSGAGKTFLMKSILLADADAGIGAFVIDPEAEYRAICERVGGQWVDLALGSGNSINVMDRSFAAIDDRDPLGDQIADLMDLIGTMCGTVSEEDRVDLHEVLAYVLQRPGSTLNDVRIQLEKRSAATRVARSLKRWTEGPIGELFARPTNVRLGAEFVVFGLRDLKEELLPVAYFLIAQWIWARVRADPRRRRLLFDEVGLLFEYPLVRRFLVRLARRVRKYQGSLCLVTQNAGDLLSSDQGLVLATNPSTLFLGAQRMAEAQRLQRAFGLTDNQTEFLGHARRGEFLLLAGEGRHRLTVSPPPWHRPALARTI